MDQSVIREALDAIRKELRSRMGKHLGPKDEAAKADEAPADESEPKAEPGIVEIVLGKGKEEGSPEEEAAESPAEEAAEDATEPQGDAKSEDAIAALEDLLKKSKGK